MSHLTDACYILFADPEDLTSDVSELSIDERIEAAEWQLEVAIANLNACVNDADLDRAAFELRVAISHMNDLCEERDAEVRRQTAENYALELDAQDAPLAEGDLSHE